MSYIKIIKKSLRFSPTEKIKEKLKKKTKTTSNLQEAKYISAIKDKAKPSQLLNMPLN